MPIVPGAHLFNQPHHTSQRERNHNEQRERKKQACFPSLFFLWVGYTSGAQGWSTEQTFTSCQPVEIGVGCLRGTVMGSVQRLKSQQIILGFPHCTGL